MEKFNISSWTANGKILHLSLALKAKKEPMEKMEKMGKMARTVSMEKMALMVQTV